MFGLSYIVLAAATLVVAIPSPTSDAPTGTLEARDPYVRRDADAPPFEKRAAR